MKKKQIIEMFIYAVIAVIGIILLMTYKPEEREISIIPDFITVGSDS